MKAGILPKYAIAFPNLAMISNGKYSMPNTSEYHRIGSVSLLSDILEEQPDQKYFLSKKAEAFLKRNRGRKTFALQLRADTTKEEKQTRI